MEKNRPKELQEIYKKHLEEVEESIRDIWENRDRILIDLKIIKSWHIKDWKTRTNESIAKIMMHQYKDLGFISNESHIFSQLLIEDVSIYIQSFAKELMRQRLTQSQKVLKILKNSIIFYENSRTMVDLMQHYFVKYDRGK